MNTERLAKLREMEAQKPEDAFLKFAIALEYMNGGQAEEAVNQFEMLLRDFPDYVPTYYQAGGLYEALGDNDKAVAVYNLGIEKAKAAGDNKTVNELKEALSLLADE